MTCGLGWSEVEGVLTRGVLLLAGERGRGDTLSGLTPGGPRAELRPGPVRSPRPSSLFFFFFHLFSLFYFSDF
jgi:hypothetical protein